MRPRRAISLALLQAAADLATETSSPTLRELAIHAKVGFSSARHSVPMLKRAGLLEIVRMRKVSYRNRPVSEYRLATPSEPEAPVTAALADALACWARNT